MDRIVQTPHILCQMSPFLVTLEQVLWFDYKQE